MKSRRHWLYIIALAVVLVLGMNAVAYAGFWDFLTNTRDENRETSVGGADMAVRG